VHAPHVPENDVHAYEEHANARDERCGRKWAAGRISRKAWFARVSTVCMWEGGGWGVIRVLAKDGSVGRSTRLE